MAAAVVVFAAALLSVHAQVLDPDIPGPEGGAGFVGIRVVRYNGLPYHIFDAQNSLLSGSGTVFDGTAPWINHSDPDLPGGGRFFRFGLGISRRHRRRQR